MVTERRPGEAWRENNRLARQSIADREVFHKGGRKVLAGEWVDGLLPDDGVGLVDDDLDRLLADAPFVVYVVWSYSTPIHWVTREGGREAWYTIAEPPSKTSAGHRNLCPGYAPEREDNTAAVRRKRARRRARGLPVK